MAAPNRGSALPLALLIVAALAAGIVVAAIRIGERDRDVTEPEPTVTSPEPTPPSPSPTTPESPTPEPTESPSPKPTVEPTEEPTEEPTGEPGNDDVLADTGGPLLPYLLGGVLMMAGSAGLWRLRRRLD